LVIYVNQYIPILVVCQQYTPIYNGIYPDSNPFWLVIPQYIGWKKTIKHICKLHTHIYIYTQTYIYIYTYPHDGIIIGITMAVEVQLRIAACIARPEETGAKALPSKEAEVAVPGAADGSMGSMVGLTMVEAMELKLN